MRRVLKPSAVEAVRSWAARQWLVAAVGAVAVAIMVGVPTDVIPNPVFGRPIAVTWWSYPVLAITAALGGLLIATYVRPQPEITPPGAENQAHDELHPAAEHDARTGGAAGLLSFFAVGCPVCNKIVLLALGTTGARQWFEPLQPLLAVLSVSLLAYALWSRLSSMDSCPIPVKSTPI